MDNIIVYSKKIWQEIFSFFKPLILSIIFVFFAFSLYAYMKGGSSTYSLHTYTLTNGKKTVVYQEMMHFGLRSFYEEVGKEITDYRNKDYKVLFEGIGATGYKSLRKGDIGYEEAVAKYKSYDHVNQQKLKDRDAKSIFNNTPYTYEKNSIYLLMAYDDDYADLSYETIDNLGLYYAKKFNMKEENSNFMDNVDFKYSQSIDDLMNQPKLYIYLSNIFDSSLFYYTNKFIYLFETYFAPNPRTLLDEVLINARDKNLAEHVLNEPNQFIYINYGAYHFRGFLSHLKENDTHWKIVSTTKKIILNSN